MTLRPAYEHVLRHGENAVALRASLRAAATIEAMPGGIAGAYEGLLRQSFTTTRAVLLATARDRQEAERFLFEIADKPLSHVLPDAQAACLAVLAAFLPAGDDDADKAPNRSGTSGGTMPLREYFQSLFGYATGWLGWTPDQTWNASAAEIEAAFGAHVDMRIKTTPGASEAGTRSSTPSNFYTDAQLAEVDRLGYDPAFDREGLRKLKATIRE